MTASRAADADADARAPDAPAKEVDADARAKEAEARDAPTTDADADEVDAEDPATTDAEAEGAPAEEATESVDVPGAPEPEGGAAGDATAPGQAGATQPEGTDARDGEPGDGAGATDQAGAEAVGTAGDESPGAAAGESAAGAGSSGGTRGGRSSRSEELAALEEQRDFLLRSLEDLEREHAAGDVDEVDYVALRDDYTARAARVIRAIERATRPRPAPRGRRARGQSAGPRRRKPMWQRVAVAGAVAAFAASTGLLVAQAAGRREAGETVTGTVRESTRDRLAQAVALASQRRFGQAIALEDEILEEQPDNVEARTYKGWFQILSGDVGAGMVTLIDAVEVDPEFPDAHAFLAVGFTRLGRPEAALAELERLDELDPPAQITQLTDQLRTQLEGEVRSGGQGEPAQPAPTPEAGSSTPPPG